MLNTVCRMIAVIVRQILCGRLFWLLTSSYDAARNCRLILHFWHDTPLVLQILAHITFIT